MELHLQRPWKSGWFRYRNSPICYQFDPISLRGVQTQNEVSGLLALQARDMVFPQRIIYHHVISPCDFPFFMKVSYVDVYTPQTWLPTPLQPNLRPQRDNGLIPAPTTTP